MKVLVVTNLYPPGFLGGYELGCAHVVEALEERGHEVLVVTSGSLDSSLEDAETAQRVLEIPPIYNRAQIDLSPPVVVHHYLLQACMVNTANVRAVGRAIEEFEPDVAYLWNLLGLGGLGILGLLRHLGIPWAWHIMDRVPRELCSLGGEPIPQLAREFGRLFGGRYLCCSSRVAGEIVAGGVDLGDDVRIVPNWVSGPRREARTTFFGGGVLRLVTAVGALSETKGTHIVIDAAARLVELGYANFTIDLYGREEDFTFRALAHQRGVTDFVRFRGLVPQAELAERYLDYDVFIFPTWAREPFGFAPLEAAAAGCVPLFSADCGIAEWMVEGVHCLKADRTAEAFAARIVNVLVGEADLGEIGRRAQSVIQRDFRLSAIVPRIEEELALAAAERREPLGQVGEFADLVEFAEGLAHVLLEEAVI